MLIKSECQPLDKTRRKPAWNLFEQRESCKMAREICNVVCPLNSHTTLLPSLRTTCPGRQMDGRTGGERCGEPTKAQLFCSLSGWHQPADTQCKQGSVMAQPHFPSLTCGWRFHQISLTITVLEARHTYVCAETKGPVIMENKASVSRLTIWMTINGKETKECSGLAGIAHNTSVMKGEVQDQKSLRQVAI